MDAPLKISEKMDFIALNKIVEVFELIRQTPKLKPGKRIVAFDLDNTLLMPTQLVGSDHWFKEHVNREQIQTGDLELAKLNALKIYQSIQKKTKVKPVEPKTASIIHTLQSQEYTEEQDYLIIGLTARNKDALEDTQQQLLSLGIDFNVGQLKGICLPCKSNPEMGLFNNGIMFAAFSNKGLAFKGLVEDLQLQVCDAFFIDDNERNVNDFIIHSGVPSIGIHYTYVNGPMLTVDLTISDIQIHYLDKILPDPIAYAIQAHYESEQSNTHLKITFKQKNEVYKPYAYFWLNHQKDMSCIQYFFNPHEYKPTVKMGFHSFKPEQPVMACCLKVPLDKSVPLVTFLYEKQILKLKDFEQFKIKLVEAKEKTVDSYICKLNRTNHNGAI